MKGPKIKVNKGGKRVTSNQFTSMLGRIGIEAVRGKKNVSMNFRPRSLQKTQGQRTCRGWGGKLKTKLEEEKKENRTRAKFACVKPLTKRGRGFRGDRITNFCDLAGTNVGLDVKKKYWLIKWELGTCKGVHGLGQQMRGRWKKEDQL